MLDLAARAAFRGTGHVEPNPLVGCVLVRPGSGPASERVIGIGHHRKFGGPHAEVEALARCRALGNDPAGATAYVTLEPCNGYGKNPPCVKALVEARVVRVVCGARDETEGKGGGGAALSAVGIPCVFTGVSQRAIDLSEPWRHRMKSDLPWVVAKWAQTIDGRLATASGDSRWISNERSRIRVHRIRAGVDAVMVGSGTVSADDPLLTVRDVPARRKPARVVVSRLGALGADRRLLLTAREARTLLLCDVPPGAEGTLELERAGVVLVRERGSADAGWLRRGLARLRAEYGVHTLMVEGGGKLLGAMNAAGLINEAHVHVGSRLMGNASGRSIDGGTEGRGPLMADVSLWRLLSVRRVGDDVQSVYRRR
jgi:diaminohydroxyphosphoribosylaminopyrimidine deaminase/5-amino-6-(5-phosphoribosylamino)uracil reductase